jgi:hypothetical protein
VSLPAEGILEIVSFRAMVAPGLHAHMKLIGERITVYRNVNVVINGGESPTVIVTGSL